MYILAICARGNSHKGASVEPHSLTCYHTYIIILCSLHCHTTLSVYACCYPTLLHAFFAYTSALDLFNLLYSTTLVPLPRSLSVARYTRQHFSSLLARRTPANRPTRGPPTILPQPQSPFRDSSSLSFVCRHLLHL